MYYRPSNKIIVKTIEHVEINLNVDYNKNKKDSKNNSRRLDSKEGISIDDESGGDLNNVNINTNQNPNNPKRMQQNFFEMSNVDLTNDKNNSVDINNHDLTKKSSKNEIKKRVMSIMFSDLDIDDFKI